MEEIAVELTGGCPLPSYQRYLVFEVSCVDEDDDDIDLPALKYRIGSAQSVG